MRLLRGFVVSALALGALALAGRGVGRTFVFRGAGVMAPAALTSASSSATAPDGFERRVLRARDGAPVHVLDRAAPAPDARTVVYFHNNRDTADARIDLARAVAARGFGVVLVEYRGYGAARESGAPTEQGLYADAEAALEMLRARSVTRERIVLWGTSLGTGIAAEMAKRGHAGGLVLETPYTSLPDLVSDVVPFAPSSMLLADHFDTLSKVGEITIPTLVLHGDADEVVPYWMGARLARALSRARLVTVPDGRHGDLFARERERLLREIEALGS